MMTEHTAYLLLGTNLGNRSENLSKATAAIRMFLGRVESQSHIYETEPWGKPHQPNFYNQAIKVVTPCSPLETLHLMKQVEFLLGRDNSEKWAPRVIDIDILFFDELAIESPVLTVPHAHIAQRRFTLDPMSEIAPDLVHPVLNKTIKELADACTDTLAVQMVDVVYQF
ncbi:MAG TPA: 2-amino-4-hydroxy-6-hydroxymethyldihydropteridine diphosphokinase [Chitinophagales bacterium]|nr:2-amino-4-hydroxy-6-hydroxymethyldihydropteridine diphosphokinase [Chitinophagales bacterium]HMZ90002.1 2-amino-4-hydroxy-6-hydroxymethyldihydropteridine diphosphokinase [Chitinophagales bacterium]HNE46774.1 2-amino-4-hydroxy-6-hydroxymethyldihydropteridine diphosphokinase [Chitinophagales bacterium]HNF69438.1 2-amino-4-hydroxy-6-hydroxymethyldihydropteridine diphosphokinase [Chitinophagales bacterium]HNI54302.1 2-amino-4-hydroxy-6-hydroxymethyldihydropteridine diphosphokinase [Chitinophagal